MIDRSLKSLLKCSRWPLSSAYALRISSFWFLVWSWKTQRSPFLEHREQSSVLLPSHFGSVSKKVPKDMFYFRGEGNIVKTRRGRGLPEKEKIREIRWIRTLFRLCLHCSHAFFEGVVMTFRRLLVACPPARPPTGWGIPEGSPDCSEDGWVEGSAGAIAR